MKPELITFDCTEQIKQIQTVEDTLKELWIIDRLLDHYGYDLKKTVSQFLCEALEELRLYREAQESGEPFYGDNDNTRELMKRLTEEAMNL